MLSLVKLVAGAFLLMSVFTVGSVSVVFGQETDPEAAGHERQQRRKCADDDHVGTVE